MNHLLSGILQVYKCDSLIIPFNLDDVNAGVNFINILLARFLYKSILSSFSLIMFGFAIFRHQNIGKKVAHKMLTKSTFYEQL